MMRCVPLRLFPSDVANREDGVERRFRLCVGDVYRLFADGARNLQRVVGCSQGLGYCFFAMGRCG